MKGEKLNPAQDSKRKDKCRKKGENHTTRFDLSNLKLFVEEERENKEKPKKLEDPAEIPLARNPSAKHNYYFLNSFKQKKNNTQHHSEFPVEQHHIPRNKNLTTLEKSRGLFKSEKRENALTGENQLCQLDDVSRKSDSSFEKVSKAFGYLSSFTKTGKIHSSNPSSEVENLEIATSMLNDEIRTLSFIEEDECHSDEMLGTKPKIPKKKKNKLKYNKSTFEKYQTPFLAEQKEASIFSTEDSRKKHHSFNQHSKQTLIFHLNQSANPNQVYLEKIEEMNESQLHFPSESIYQENKDVLDEFGAKREFEYNNLSSLNLNLDLALQDQFKISTSPYVPKKSLLQHDYGKNKRNSEPIKDDTNFRIQTSKIMNLQKTTLMIRNIPNKYTKELMITTIDKNYKGTYDFFYLPIDFKRNCNVGYAFINFIDVKFIQSFFEEFHSQKWKMFNSEKICEITYARLQGKNACEEHFKNSSLMKQPVS